MNPIFERDGGVCAYQVPGVCRGRAESVDHRIHGNRKDRRSSNLVSACGDGTVGCHGWKEAHPALAGEYGWTLSRHGVNPAEAPIYLKHGIYGEGWYLLDDDFGLRQAA